MNDRDTVLEKALHYRFSFQWNDETYVVYNKQVAVATDILFGEIEHLVEQPTQQLFDKVQKRIEAYLEPYEERHFGSLEKFFDVHGESAVKSAKTWLDWWRQTYKEIH